MLSVGYAVSAEAFYVSDTQDYSVSSSRAKLSTFDSTENLENVLSSITRPNSDDLRYSAAVALERLKARQDDSVEAWAEKLSQTMFLDLDQASR